MSESSIPFFAQAALLDSYIKSDNPSEDEGVLNLILKILREKPDLRLYFFQNSPHPAWANILWDNDFLINPPEPIVNEDHVNYPFWDAQQYLTSVAEYVPEIVVKHIQKIKGHNWYKGRAIWTLQNVPEKFINDAMPTILQWLSNRDTSEVIAVDAFNFMLHIAEKKFSAALDLMEVLTTPLPSKNVDKTGDYLRNTQAVSILRDSRWSYRSEKTFNLLNNIDARRVALILEKQLLLSLKIEHETEQKAYFDYKQYTGWRNAIEDTGQDLHDEFKDILLESLRDNVEYIVVNDKAFAEKILNSYENHEFNILQRLRLHILQKFPDEFPKQVRSELLKESNFDEIKVHHEFFMLLKNGFHILSTKKRQLVIKIILKGPEREKIADFAKWMNRETTPEEQEAYIDGYIKRWIRDRLFMIKDFLKGDQINLFNTLIAEESKPEHPEFTSWSSGAYFVSDVSPLDPTQLSSIPPSKLFEFLKKWQPQPNQFGPERVSYRGLGQTLSAVITSEPFKYEKFFVKIGMFRPEFAYAFLNQFIRNDNKDNERFPLEAEKWSKLWGLYFDLSEAIVNDDNLSKDMDRTSEIIWRDTRHSIVNLIESEFRKIYEEKYKIYPYFDLNRVREILIKLTDDPDPDLESDRPKEGWVGHEDPVTVAINHVRPDALLALIDGYSMCLAHLNQNEGLYPDTECPGPNRLDPKVEEVLTKKLDRRTDKSWSVHSIFGRTLVALYWMNRQWVKDHLEEIFIDGQDEESLKYFVAAWDSFVIFNHPHYAELFKLLRPKYVKAIENHSKGYVIKTHLEPRKNLARHLLGEYLFGSYEIKSPEGQESLLALFFDKVPPATRGNAIWLLWKTFEEDKKSAEKFWERAKSLWRWRVEIATSLSHPSDFNDEMNWFPHLLKFAPKTETILTIWDLLEGTLPYLARINHFGMIWEEIESFLLREVTNEPLKLIQFYRLMHDFSRRPTWFSDESRGKKILEIGAENKESRDATLSLIDFIASKGDHSYRYIYDKYAK